MKKLTVYFPSLAPEQGGTVSAIMGICELMATHNADVSLWTRDRADHEDGSYPIHVIPKNQTITQTNSFIEELDETECVYLHAPWHLPNQQISKLAENRNKPIVLALHGMLDDYCIKQKRIKKNIFFNLFTRALIRRVTKIHCTASEEQKQAGKLTKSIRDKSRVVPLPVTVDTKRINETDEVAKANTTDHFRLLFVGRIHPIKNIETILKGLKIARDRGIPCKLDLLGASESGYHRSLAKLAKSIGIGDCVKFHGHVDKASLATWYSHSSACVLTSHHENFGLSAVEAISHGCPAIIGKGVMIWRELQSAGAQVVTNQTDIAEAITNWYHSDSSRKRASRQGIDFISNWLSLTSLADEYMSLFFE